MCFTSRSHISTDLNAESNKRSRHYLCPRRHSQFRSSVWLTATDLWVWVTIFSSNKRSFSWWILCKTPWLEIKIEPIPISSRSLWIIWLYFVNLRHMFHVSVPCDYWPLLYSDIRGLHALVCPRNYGHVWCRRMCLFPSFAPETTPEGTSNIWITKQTKTCWTRGLGPGHKPLHPQMIKLGRAGKSTIYTWYSHLITSIYRGFSSEPRLKTPENIPLNLPAIINPILTYCGINNNHH